MSAFDPLALSTVRDIVRELVRIPSVNPSLAPGEGTGEAEVAAFARDWLAAHGVKAWIEDAAPEGSVMPRPNVVAEVGGGDGASDRVGDRARDRARDRVSDRASHEADTARHATAARGVPTLVFCAHLDTVGTAGMTIPPFEPRVQGDRLYGRGSYDMKGSAGAILAAMAALARDGGLRCRVKAALVADEEYASVGAFAFAARHAAQGCIVTEPAQDGMLVLAHKGFVWATIVTRGRAAHGSRWDLGDSAIARMGRIIAALDQFDRTELRARVHPLVGPASLHCALIDGGTGLSTYAQACRLQVERRTLPGETVDDVRRELEDVIARAGEAAHATVDCHFDRPPLTCDPRSAVATAVRDAVTEETGRAPIDGGVGFWMDAAVFAQAGVATVNYGPTGAGAHEAVEWVDLPSVARTARVLVNAARRFAG